MTRTKRRLVGCLSFAVLGVLLVPGFIRFLFDHSTPRPVCHKQLSSLITHWRDSPQAKNFPNVDGDSEQSVQALKVADFLTNWGPHYSYVPGLEETDPGDLVLFYINQPTRWTWHGQHPTVFESKAWILVPVDMKMTGPGRPDAGPGEASERVSFNEFKARLRKTLDYLQQQQRAHWEQVVKTHEEFLAKADREFGQQ